MRKKKEEFEMTKEEVTKILDLVPASEVIEEHKRWREIFLYGTVEECMETAKILGYIEEYICDRVTKV